MRANTKKRFRPDQLLRNQQGVIFLTVLVLSLIFCVILVSSLSLLVSQTTSGQDVVSDIRSEQLALGTFYRYQQAKHDNAVLSSTGDEIFGSKKFSYSIDEQAAIGPNNTNQVQITINY